MPTLRAIAPLFALLALGGCVANSGVTSVSGYGQIAPPPASLFGTDATEVVVGEVAEPHTSLNPELAALLEPRGRSIAERAQYQALEGSAAGVSVRWRTPDSSVRGEVVPGPLYAVNVQTCRDFTHAIELGANRFSRRGTACRDAGGSWVLIG